MPHSSGLCAVLLPALLLVGCGTDVYKSRLKETAQYFAYKEKLNQELGPPWSAMGVTWQPPREFVSIPAPPPPAVEEGEELAELDPTDDPRQPQYLDLVLPGLLGAWEATVQAEVGGEDEPRTAYLYLLGNHERYLQKPDAAGFVEDPQAFIRELESRLSEAIGVVLPEGEGTGVEKNRRYRETAPRVEPNVKFTSRKDFTAVTLQPQIDVGDLDLPFEIQLYEWTGRQIQVAIVMVYPQSISPRENLQESLLLALETLNVADAAPTGAAAANGGDAAGTGRPAGF
jgi:hypothetical protein